MWIQRGIHVDQPTPDSHFPGRDPHHHKHWKICVNSSLQIETSRHSLYVRIINTIVQRPFQREDNRRGQGESKPDNFGANLEEISLYHTHTSDKGTHASGQCLDIFRKYKMVKINLIATLRNIGSVKSFEEKILENISKDSRCQKCEKVWSCQYKISTFPSTKQYSEQTSFPSGDWEVDTVQSYNFPGWK